MVVIIILGKTPNGDSSIELREGYKVSLETAGSWLPSSPNNLHVKGSLSLASIIPSRETSLKFPILKVKPGVCSVRWNSLDNTSVNLISEVFSKLGLWFKSSDNISMETKQWFMTESNYKPVWVISVASQEACRGQVWSIFSNNEGRQWQSDLPYLWFKVSGDLWVAHRAVGPNMAYTELLR